MLTVRTDSAAVNRRWNRGSWAAALFALFIAAYTSLQFISLLGVPTDGWIAVIDERPAVPRVALSVQIRDPARSARSVLQAGDMVYVPRDKISKIERFMRIASVAAFMMPGL